MANKLTLAEHRKALGLSVSQLAQLAGVDKKVIVEAEYLKGGPIAKVKAEKIAAALSKEYERPITINDVVGLKVI